MELAGSLGTPLGFAQWKRASSRGEAGTSGFLSVSDSDPPISGVFRVQCDISSLFNNLSLLGIFSPCSKILEIAVFSDELL